MSTELQTHHCLTLRQRSKAPQKNAEHYQSLSSRALKITPKTFCFNQISPLRPSTADYKNKFVSAVLFVIYFTFKLEKSSSDSVFIFKQKLLAENGSASRVITAIMVFLLNYLIFQDINCHHLPSKAWETKN